MTETITINWWGAITLILFAGACVCLALAMVFAQERRDKEDD